MPVTIEEICELADTLPRSYQAIARGRVKYRIGQIVYLSLAEDGSTMGCGFPKEFREAAVAGEPHKFSFPSESDLRFNWIHVNLAAIDAEEMRDLVEDAWAFVVPKRVAGQRQERSLRSAIQGLPRLASGVRDGCSRAERRHDSVCARRPWRGRTGSVAVRGCGAGAGRQTAQ